MCDPCRDRRCRAVEIPRTGPCEPMYSNKNDDATGRKMYYQWVERGWVTMAAWVKMGDDDNADQADKKARELGERWS